jgi:hypothetical protein
MENTSPAKIATEGAGSACRETGTPTATQPEFRVRGRLPRIVRVEGDGYVFLNNPEQAVEHLRAHGPRADLLTFIQALPDAAPKFPYPFEMDNFAGLRVTTHEEWLRGLSPRIRTQTRQAERRGVEIREIPFDDDTARGIWEIYNETPVRQGRRFPHYGKDLETVRRMSATFPDLSVFIGAFFEGRMIGFIKLVANQAGTQAGIMHILSLEAHRDKAPTNGLLASAVRACEKRRIEFLTYCSYTYGKKAESSLSEFKRRNGFRRMDVPRYYVPLTRRGAVAFRLGLHHGLKDRLPESVASRLRDARAAWYQRKYDAAHTAS